MTRGVSAVTKGQRPEKLAGDKAYRARHIRAWLWGTGLNR
jgi:hypothetical protein